MIKNSMRPNKDDPYTLYLEHKDGVRCIRFTYLDTAKSAIYHAFLDNKIILLVAYVDKYIAKGKYKRVVYWDRYDIFKKGFTKIKGKKE